MPRDNSGTYSLPSGNPVATETVISASWANNTMGDIARELTFSLDRNGKGGMSVPFQNGDGTVLLPGISFINEDDSGWYREALNDMRCAINGVDTAQYIAAIGTIGQQHPFLTWNGSAFVAPLSGTPDEEVTFGDVTVGSFSIVGGTAPFGLNTVRGNVNKQPTTGVNMAYGYGAFTGGLSANLNITSNIPVTGGVEFTFDANFASTGLFFAFPEYQADLGFRGTIGWGAAAGNVAFVQDASGGFMRGVSVFALTFRII